MVRTYAAACFLAPFLAAGEGPSKRVSAAALHNNRRGRAMPSSYTARESCNGRSRLCLVQFISIRIHQVEGRHGEEVEKEEIRKKEKSEAAAEEGELHGEIEGYVRHVGL
jgi:hypothetical protein